MKTVELNEVCTMNLRWR